EPGFSLRVGGGLSTDPRLAERLDAFVRWHQAVPVVRAVTEIFRDSDVLREHREKARLKFLFLRHGWTAERFLAEVEARLGYALDRAPEEPRPEEVYRDHVGIHPQRQPDLCYAGATVLRGRLTAAPAELPRAREAARHGVPELVRTALDRRHRRGGQEAQDRRRTGRRLLLLRRRRARCEAGRRAAHRSARARQRGGIGRRAAAARVPGRAPRRRDVPRLRRAARRRHTARVARRRPRPRRGARPGGRSAARGCGRVTVALFPLFVELAGRPCVVIGGGAVAERKVHALLTAGAVVTVVSPALSPALATLADA